MQPGVRVAASQRIRDGAQAIKGKRDVLWTFQMTTLEKAFKSYLQQIEARPQVNVLNVLGPDQSGVYQTPCP
jgi:hypothetical protein